MRIGLIRHFPVDQPLPTGWKTAADLIAWRESYDLATALVGEAQLGAGGWQACLSSDLPRTLVHGAGGFFRPDRSDGAVARTTVQ
jgi:hypothetical protein